MLYTDFTQFSFVVHSKVTCKVLIVRDRFVTSHRFFSQLEKITFRVFVKIIENAHFNPSLHCLFIQNVEYCNRISVGTMSSYNTEQFVAYPYNANDAPAPIRRIKSKNM
jgi:hypothetical protein